MVWATRARLEFGARVGSTKTGGRVAPHGRMLSEAEQALVQSKIEHAQPTATPASRTVMPLLAGKTGTKFG